MRNEDRQRQKEKWWRKRIGQVISLSLLPLFCLRPVHHHTVNIPIKNKPEVFSFSIELSNAGIVLPAVEWMFTTTAMLVSLLWLAVKTRARFLKTAPGSRLLLFFFCFCYCFWGGGNLGDRLVHHHCTWQTERCSYPSCPCSLQWRKIIQTQKCVAKGGWNTQ